MKVFLLAAVCLFSAWTAPASAQTPPEAEAAELEPVVVTARRIGVPVWRITGGAGTMVLVGHINQVPRDAKWNPRALEEAVGLADRVVFPTTKRVSAADLGRILFRARRLALLPQGKTLDDYISPELGRRMDALQARGLLPADYKQRHPYGLIPDLLRYAGGRLRGGDDAGDIIADAARKLRIPQETVGVLTGDAILDGYIEGGPAVHIPCLENAVAAAEIGAEAGRRRIEAWTRSRVAEVAASPIDQATLACFPYGVQTARGAFREQWRAAIDKHLARPGVTLAVVPIQFLAEPEGLLDRLAARGLAIEGPRWREQPDAAPSDAVAPASPNEVSE